jgi:hypothetical protein
MSAQNTYAMLGMCAIVITLYAMKESHVHYLPDFFGLVLALAAPRPSYAIGCVLVLALIRHSRLAHGLSDSIPSWLLLVALPGALNMSRLEEDYSQAESAYKKRISEENDTHEMDEIPQPVAETREELICLGETIALARLVAAEQIKLTEAVKIGAAAKSGPKYQKRSKEVKAQIEAIRNHYPPGSNLKQFK